MCLLIYKTQGVTIPESHLEQGFCSNSHGAGFTVRMVNEVGEGYLHRERGFFKYADFIEAYRPFAECQGIVHFRLATAGLKDEANCHPFEVSPDIHMGHNGIISIAQSISKDHSDTWHYKEQVLKPIHQICGDKFWSEPSLHFLFSQSIGHSKLAFIHADGRHLLINEEDGHWNDKSEPTIWYSNDSYEAPRYTYKPSAGFGGWKDWSFSSSKDSGTEAVDRKDIRRLERARQKLQMDGFEWLVDEAFDAGMPAAEILAHASEDLGHEVLYDFVYGRDMEGRGYRSWGDSLDQEEWSLR